MFRRGARGDRFLLLDTGRHQLVYAGDPDHRGAPILRDPFKINA